jgi:glycosyltransferase involved in cell wall biosynthesis
VKILLVYKYFLPNIGGIENLMYLIAEMLSKHGLDISILSTDLIHGVPSLPQTDEAGGYKIHRIHSLGSIMKQIDLTIDLNHVVKVVKEADIVHIFSSTPSSLLYSSIFLSKLTRKPILWQPIYHPIRLKTYNSILRLLGYIHDSGMVRLLSKLVHSVICLTDDESRFFRNFGIKNVYVLGECAKEVSIPHYKVLRVLEKYQLEYGGYVLSVGRIVWYKGYDLLIRTWGQMEEKFPNLKLVIVGSDGGYKQNLEKMISRFGSKNVIFTGSVDDPSLHALYEGCNCVVSLSRFETFHRIAIEAWSHRKPIVALNLGGPTIHISSDTGILVNDDVSEVYRALIELLGDEERRKAMGMKGYEKFRRLYSVESYTNRLLDIYNKALNNV